MGDTDLMATYTVPIDSPVIPIDYNHTTIEGADAEVRAIKERPIHPNDYLGVGTPIYNR